MQYTSHRQQKLTMVDNIFRDVLQGIENIKKLQAKNSSNEMNQFFYEFFGLDISKLLAHYRTVRYKR